MHSGLLFTGTDTGVGKTFVAAQVARLLHAKGHPVCVRKPVATGAEWVGAGWLSGDTRALAAAVGETDWSRITPWTFPEPVAPAVAARRHGRELNLTAIARSVLDGVPDGSVVVVEGVGGLLCPLTASETVADLAVLLGLPVVMVTRRSLGTLSLTLMAEEVARFRRLPLAGVVVSETTPCQSLAEDTNVEELRSRLMTPLLAVCYHQPGAEPVPQPELEGVDWRQLCRGTL